MGTAASGGRNSPSEKWHPQGAIINLRSGNVHAPSSKPSALWYAGPISRSEAVKRLMRYNSSPGTFLLRDSTNWPGEYCLSVVKPPVKHYRIQHNHNRGYFLEEMKSFQTLQELIKHHSQAPQGLCTTLKYAQGGIISGPARSTGIEIDRKYLKKIRQLDQGFFGKVYEGELYGNIPVAIKELKKGSMDVNDFSREAHLLRDLDHSNLIILHGVCMKEEPLWIVTELMPNGSLLKYLKGKGRSLNMKNLMDIATQVASGMEYLEEKNCIHRDLAARNVLVGDDNTFLVKIADFGMARWVKEQDYVPRNKDAAFPIKWTAPEAANDQKFSIKSDVWSYGIVLWEVVTYGDKPYSNMKNSEALTKVTQGYRMPCPKNCPVSVYHVMMDCWSSSPDDRPTFSILKHRMIKVLNINDNTTNRSNSRTLEFYFT